MSGADDCHQSEARHLHGRPVVNRIGLRCFHLDARRVRPFGSRTVVTVDLEGVDRVDVLSAVNDGDSLLCQQHSLLITSVDSCC